MIVLNKLSAHEDTKNGQPEANLLNFYTVIDIGKWEDSYVYVFTSLWKGGENSKNF